MGDAFIHPAQITEPTWDSMFDVGKETAHQTRRRLLERITADDAIASVEVIEAAYASLARCSWTTVPLTSKVQTLPTLEIRAAA